MIYIFRFHHGPIQFVLFVPVGLSSICWHVLLVFVGCRNFLCRPAWAIGFHITDEGRFAVRWHHWAGILRRRLLSYRPLQWSLFICGSFRVNYEHSFFYCFHFMSFSKGMVREYGLTFRVSEIFPVFWIMIFRNNRNKIIMAITMSDSVALV